MAILIRPGRHYKKARAGNGEEILKKIDTYLKMECKEPVEILCGFWKDQQNVFSYQELRLAVMDGTLTEQTFREWSQDYSLLVQNQLRSMWDNAVIAGSVSQPIMNGLTDFAFSINQPGVMNWIQTRGAQLVTQCTQTQKDAISVLLEQSVRERYTVDELSRLIRPCIGLTAPQAKANRSYYDSIVKSLREQHPKMKAESIKSKALDAATKYAERQHRQRAMNIAQTEMAYAYNKGADEGIRQTQEQQLIGKVVKRWCTANDDGVCEICRGLEGTEIAMDDSFDFKGSGKITGENLTPPAHPRCACAIEYIEVNSTDY